MSAQRKIRANTLVWASSDDCGRARRLDLASDSRADQTRCCPTNTVALNANCVSHSNPESALPLVVSAIVLALPKSSELRSGTRSPASSSCSARSSPTQRFSTRWIRSVGYRDGNRRQFRIECAVAELAELIVAPHHQLRAIRATLSDSVILSSALANNPHARLDNTAAVLMPTRHVQHFHIRLFHI